MWLAESQNLNSIHSAQCHFLQELTRLVELEIPNNVCSQPNPVDVFFTQEISDSNTWTRDCIPEQPHQRRSKHTETLPRKGSLAWPTCRHVLCVRTECRSHSLSLPLPHQSSTWSSCLFLRRMSSTWMGLRSSGKPYNNGVALRNVGDIFWNVNSTIADIGLQCFSRCSRKCWFLLRCACDLPVTGMFKFWWLPTTAAFNCHWLLATYKLDSEWWPPQRLHRNRRNVDFAIREGVRGIR